MSKLDANFQLFLFFANSLKSLIILNTIDFPKFTCISMFTLGWNSNYDNVIYWGMDTNPIEFFWDTGLRGFSQIFSAPQSQRGHREYLFTKKLKKIILLICVYLCSSVSPILFLGHRSSRIIADILFTTEAERTQRIFSH